MRAFQLISGISFQANVPATTDMEKLEAHILIPSICIIMVVVMIAGIVVAVQKHKRY